MKAVITGMGGFVGTHLYRHLIKEGWEVVSFDLKFGYDIRDFEVVRNFLDSERPDVIFHLAAQAFVPESFTNPQRVFEVNTIGSLNILEAVKQLGLKTTIHLAGTSEEYGDGNTEEESLLRPKSPYAISKVAMDYLGQLYSRAYDMHVVVTRAFNHTGPGRGEMYAESAWAKQIAEYEKGKRDFIEHGNLESVRNYTDVRDIVKAYALTVDCPSGVYNICSDQNVKMSEVMDILCEWSEHVPLKQREALLRPVDFSFKKPNCESFKSFTGWKPEYELETTLKDLLDYWRKKV